MLLPLVSCVGWLSLLQRLQKQLVFVVDLPDLFLPVLVVEGTGLVHWFGSLLLFVFLLVWEKRDSFLVYQSLGKWSKEHIRSLQRGISGSVAFVAEVRVLRIVRVAYIASIEAWRATNHQRIVVCLPNDARLVLLVPLTNQTSNLPGLSSAFSSTAYCSTTGSPFPAASQACSGSFFLAGTLAS